MKFGPLPLDEAIGATLAHSIRGEGFALKKGTHLTPEDAATLRAAGLTEVIAAQLDPGDIPENEAAERMAKASCGPGLRVDPAFTGRCNLRAEAAGILRVDTAAINAANAVDEALTIATPPDYARLGAGQLAATAKVIPYAAQGDAVAKVEALLSGAMRVHPFRPMQITLIVTQTEGQKDSVITKGAEAIRTRLTALGSTGLTVETVPHTEAATRAAPGGERPSRPDPDPRWFRNIRPPRHCPRRRHRSGRCHRAVRNAR